MTRLHGILALAVAAGFGILLIAIPAELAPFLDGRMRQVVLAVVAAAVGVTLTASLVAAHFRYRFAHLVKTAERIAGGDYTATVVPRGYGFEARLGRAVNDIAAALVDTHDRATFDRLTGVANRQSLLAQLFAEVERAARYERPLSVAFVDIDHFKAVNDTYGHAVGDVVLRGVAQEISDNLRASDMIGRYGGEEFMLILTETGVEEGAVLTEKLRSLVQRRRFTIDGAPDIAVTISIGIAGGSGAKLRMDTLVRDADAAMYSAKSLGRNQTYIFAEPDDDARVPRAPISAAGRARAMAIGQLAREAATSALASVLDPLPHYRGQPSALIASIVVALGRQLQLPDAEIDRLRVAALLHDVGKIAVPEEILEKPSALTSAEWRTVVQHPRIGQVILEQAATLKDAVPIILHHHERYAGHGYPYGLRANEIPLGARIVAIADAYDAMINDRPYKRAISHEQAISELRRHAGTQFDPELVELFCDLYADQAPEPDQTVVAMAAAHRGQGRPALVLPDLGTGRTVRKRRPIAPLATPDGGLAGGTGRRGARGVADPGARRRARAGTRGRRPDQQAIRPAIEGRPHGHRCRLTSPTGTLWDGSRNSECRPRYLADEGPSLACRSTPAADAGSGPEHPADREGDRTVNKVMLTGRLTRDPEMRSLASGKNVTTFTVASNEFLGGGREKAEYSNVVTWDRLAEIAGTYLGKGQQVAIEGRLQTRSWDDDRGQRHWKTEVVASHVETLSGRRKKDYEAQQAADSLVAQAERFGDAPPTEPVPESAEVIAVDGDDDDDDETEEGEGAAA